MTTSYDDTQVYNNTVIFQSNVIFNSTVTLPTGSIDNNSIVEGADLDADKLEHRHSKQVMQEPGVDVVDKTYYVHIARANGRLKSVTVRPIVVPVGGDKQYTIDVRKVNNAVAVPGTSLLSAVVTISSVDDDNTNQTAALVATPSYVSGDMIIIVIDATGTTGTQGQGVIVDVELDESGV